jgi:phosphatidylserine/phosphatidylglycerophosphate/cardiolipin synthase-like enzyme
MTVTFWDGLRRVPLPVLHLALEAIRNLRVECPVMEDELLAEGFGAASGPLANALRNLERDGAERALNLVIAERALRAVPQVSLVWTGPESGASVSRDTSMVVRDLFANARRCVIVGGYVFDDPDILRPLHRAMAERGVTAQLFMNIPSEAVSLAEADAVATRVIDAFLREVWTFGAPKPEVLYDPRTAVRGPPWTSLHAKCVVVDDERTLITSANFTDRGQSRNIETGVLVEDRLFAEELAGQWRMLIAGGLVRRYGG